MKPTPSPTRRPDPEADERGEKQRQRWTPVPDIRGGRHRAANTPPRTARGTRARIGLAGLGALCALFASGCAVPFAVASPTRKQVPRLAGRIGPKPSRTVIREARYSLVLSSRNSNLTVETPSGPVYTRFPLTALAGRSSVPQGLQISVRRTLTGLVATASTTTGNLISRATLTASPSFFTVSFEATLGPDTGLAPRFFDDGDKGLDWSEIQRRLSPDPRGGLLSATPSTRVGQGTSFAPPRSTCSCKPGLVG